MLFYSVCASYISCGDADGKVYVWDWKSTKLYSKFKAHDDVCISVLWHPHETSKMATAGWDGVIKYWDWDIGILELRCLPWTTGTEILEYWNYDVCLGLLGLRYWSWNTGTEMSVLEYQDTGTEDVCLGILWRRSLCLGILGLRYWFWNTFGSWNSGTEKSVLEYRLGIAVHLGILGLRCLSWNAGTEILVLEYWDWDIGLGILGLRCLSLNTGMEVSVLACWDWDICLGILGLRCQSWNTGAEMSVLEFWDWEVCLAKTDISIPVFQDREHLSPSQITQNLSVSHLFCIGSAKALMLRPLCIDLMLKARQQLGLVPVPSDQP